MSDKDDEMARLARRDPEYSHIPDDTLDDWYRRWPSTLPTSVPHEQVRMLVENVRVARARIAELEERLGITRMCVNCGKCKPAAEPIGEPLPECVGPDGLSACTFNTTPQEAWEYWRKRAVELEAKVRERDEALKIAKKGIDAAISLMGGAVSERHWSSYNAALAHPLIGGAK